MSLFQEAETNFPKCAHRTQRQVKRIRLSLNRWGPTWWGADGGAQEWQETLPSGSPLWTSGLPPCARRRMGRWPSGTESRGRCLGACLGEWEAERITGLNWATRPASHVLHDSCGKCCFPFYLDTSLEYACHVPVLLCLFQ